MTTDTRTPAEKLYDDTKSGAIYFQRPAPAGDIVQEAIDFINGELPDDEPLSDVEAELIDILEDIDGGEGDDPIGLIIAIITR